MKIEVEKTIKETWEVRTHREAFCNYVEVLSPSRDIIAWYDGKWKWFDFNDQWAPLKVKEAVEELWHKIRPLADNEWRGDIGGVKNRTAVFIRLYGDVARADDMSGFPIVSSKDLRVDELYADVHRALVAWEKRTRPLKENEHVSLAGGARREWSWVGGEPTCIVVGNEFDRLPLRCFTPTGSGVFEFGLAWARKTCPPGLRVNDDGTVSEVPKENREPLVKVTLDGKTLFLGVVTDYTVSHITGVASISAVEVRK